MCIAFVKTEVAPLPTDDDKNMIPNDLLTSSTTASTDSDGSLHSLNSSTSLPLSSKAPIKKRVRFEEAPPTIVGTMKPSSSMTSDERSSIFWQLSDYEYFRGTARIIAAEVLKLSATQPKNLHGYDTVLTRAHQVCSSHGSLEISNLDEEKENLQGISKDDEVCLPPNLFAALTHWTKAGHSRRGLEKFCVPHHMQVRPVERQAVIQAVLIAQDLLKEQRQDPKDGKFVLGTWEFSLNLPDEEILHTVSERFTKTSRKFATAMGHADAAAVGNYEYNAL